MTNLEPRGLHAVSTRESGPARVYLRAAAALLFLSLAALWVATEFVASRFGFQRALGAPLAPYVYVPWASFEWMFQFSNVSDPRVHALLRQFWTVWAFLEIATLPIILAMTVKGGGSAAHADLHYSGHWVLGGEL